MDTNISNFVHKQLELLSLEQENCTDFHTNISPDNYYQLESIGHALKKLTITNTVIKGPQHLQIDLQRVGGLPLEHRLSKGDLVICIRSTEKREYIRGTVVLIDESTLSISINSQYKNIDKDETLTVVKTDSDHTYKCQTRALKRLEANKLQTTVYLQIATILFDDNKDVVNSFLTAQDPIPNNYLDKEGKLKFFNKNLVKDQRLAIEFALKQRYFAIIQGPPGTGKTTTLIEIIIQLHQMGKKILICAPTNVAVDNLAIRLGETQVKPLRLGHSSRIAPEVLKYSLDSHIEKDDDFMVLRDIRKSIKDVESNIENNNAKYLYKEARELNKEFKQKLSKLTQCIIKKSSVILCTLNSASPSDSCLQNKYFDVLIVDEASQAMEASMWIAIPNAAKLILAGDIYQLPPVVMNKKAINGGLNISLMERAIKKLDDNCFINLTRQYRMNEKIMNWSNTNFYSNTLEADTSNKNHLLKDLTDIKKNNCFANEALVYINTCGCDCEEYNTEIELSSKGNLGEAVIVAKVVSALIKIGVRDKDIGVITPYTLQVNFIDKLFMAKSLNVKVSTVDGFQGREKEVIILSLVRSNQDRELGFVTDCRRLNVAVTRARRLLIVIADSETVEKDKIIDSLLKHIEHNGLLQTAQEYLSETADNEINEISNIAQVNLRHKVKAKEKVISSKQENKIRSAVSNTKDEKNINEQINVKTLPKVGKGRSSKKLQQSANSNKYNIFETLDTADSDENVAGKSEENSQMPEYNASSRESERQKSRRDVENIGNENKETDNIDKIIEKFRKINSVCSFHGCKKSTNLIRLICEFCKKWYCIEHSVQEIHGCGNAIRRKEQKLFKHKKPEISITERDKNKFARKLKEMEDARKPKKKSTK